VVAGAFIFVVVGLHCVLIAVVLVLGLAMVVGRSPTFGQTPA
jgi:hypothetical protein